MVENKAVSHLVFFDNVDIRVFYLNKNQGLPLHEHTTGHMVICGSGSIVCRSNNTEVILNKYSEPFYFQPCIPHEIEALEDNSMCINIGPKLTQAPHMPNYKSAYV
jgi:quercetin dioxygenase-like cupin family protein